MIFQAPICHLESDITVCIPSHKTGPIVAKGLHSCHLEISPTIERAWKTFWECKDDERNFSKEVPPIWRLHQSGFRRVIIWANYLSLPIGEVGESEGTTLYVPRPSKLKKKEIILAGGAGGDGGVGIGRRGDELELWRIQYYFYQSHCFFLVHLKVEVKTSLLPLSLFVVVILSS